METVRWRKYVGAPNPPLITYLILSDLIRYVIRYSIALKDHEKDPGGTLYNCENRPNPKVRYELYPKPNHEVGYRYVNVLKKTKVLMLITYVFSTYLWYISPDPYIVPILV